MENLDISSILVIVTFIGLGLFLKTTNNENFKPMKKWWKISLGIGVVNLVMELTSMYL
tara:strand:- start:9069 stop:9242 length:174 start_codon:yes stop_codon:yes gene_type:complete